MAKFKKILKDEMIGYHNQLNKMKNTDISIKKRKSKPI